MQWKMPWARKSPTSKASEVAGKMREPLAALWQRFAKKRWSPWVCGALLGILAFLSILVAEDRLGVTGGFQTLASFLARLLGVEDAGRVMFTIVKPPLLDPQLALFVGMVAGALVAAALSHDVRPRAIPETQWKERFGPSVAKRWAIVFLGAALMEAGAIVAGGCTSGLGVSGTMQLSPAGIAFIVGCFSAGIVVANLLYAGRKGR